MRLAELSAETEVPVPTLKYYLREGLLPPGERRSATWAEYDVPHVERVRLIRALLGVGVPIEGIRRVLEAVERPPASRHDFLGVAQRAIDGEPPAVPVAADTRAALARLGWDECEPGALGHLQTALDTAERAGYPVPPQRLAAYGEAMARVAREDLDALAADPAAATPGGALRHVAVGTLVTDPVLVALRRIAQEKESERRFG